MFYTSTKNYGGEPGGHPELVITARLVVPACMVAEIGNAIAKFNETGGEAVNRHVSTRLDVN